MMNIFDTILDGLILLGIGAVLLVVYSSYLFGDLTNLEDLKDILLYGFSVLFLQLLLITSKLDRHYEDD